LAPETAVRVSEPPPWAASRWQIMPGGWEEETGNAGRGRSCSADNWLFDPQMEGEE